MTLGEAASAGSSDDATDSGLGGCVGWVYGEVSGDVRLIRKTAVDKMTRCLHSTRLGSPAAAYSILLLPRTCGNIRHPLV